MNKFYLKNTTIYLGFMKAYSVPMLPKKIEYIYIQIYM